MLLSGLYLLFHVASASAFCLALPMQACWDQTTNQFSLNPQKQPHEYVDYLICKSLYTLSVGVSLLRHLICGSAIGACYNRIQINFTFNHRKKGRERTLAIIFVPMLVCHDICFLFGFASAGMLPWHWQTNYVQSIGQKATEVLWLCYCMYGGICLFAATRFLAGLPAQACWNYISKNNVNVKPTEHRGDMCTYTYVYNIYIYI